MFSFAAFAAAAALAWTPTAQLSQGHAEHVGDGWTGSSYPVAAMDARGAALVAWSTPRVPGDATSDVYVAAARAGEGFGSPKLVVSGRDPGLTVLPDGTALLVVSPGNNERQQLLVGRVDGTFGTPRPINRTREYVTGLFPIRHGALALVGRYKHTTLVREISAKGELGPARDVGLGRYLQPGIAYVGGSPGEVARGGDGTLVFPLGRELVVRRPNGVYERHATPIKDRFSDLRAAAGPDGEVAVTAIVHAVYGEASAYGDIAVATLDGEPRLMPVHRKVQWRTHDQPRTWGFGANLAYDGRGRLVVGWIEDALPDPGEEREDAVGRAILYSRGHRITLDRSARWISMIGRRDGVLALGDDGPLTARLAGGPPIGAPQGRIYNGSSLASSPARSLFAFNGYPDAGVRVAFLPR